MVAGVAFFVSGGAALRAFARGLAFRRVLLSQLALLAIPWAMLTMTLLWRPNCGYLQGLLFYLLFAPFSVALAVALAYALMPGKGRGSGWVFGGIGLAIVLAGPVYDLGFHPQFYTYNHVFGGVLGPIYDEDLAVRPGLFAFRGLTVLWTLLAYLFGRWRRMRDGPARRRVLGMAAVAALGLGLGYAFAAPLGINTPAWYLRAQLGAVHRTPHFDLYYDPASLSAADLRYLAEDHEYHYARLAHRLGVDVPGRIASYLYPDPDTKARLTGARLTNVAPVWLAQPQVHVLHESYEGVFAHELVHVFSRSFGVPILRASLLVGLVEGLAVALEPPDGRPSPHEQVLTATLEDVGLADATLAADLATRLTPLGFWTGRGAVSYTTMGSFVAYLLDTYGAAPLKRVYAFGDFERVYGKSPEALAAEWQASLASLHAVARDAGPFVARRFAAPSLFEKPCPHHVPAYRRRYRAAVRALAEGDTARAEALVDASLEGRRSYVPALDLWSRLALARGDAGAVVARLDTMAVDTLSAALAVRLGDALALQARPERARQCYEAAYRLLPHYALEDRARVVLRKSLARRPDVLRILVSGAASDAMAERLSQGEGEAEWMALLRAERLAAAEQFEQAASLLRTTPIPTGGATLAEQRLLEWQRLRWLAWYTYRSGQPAAAAAYAREASGALRRAGAWNEAARLDVFAQKMNWILQQT